MKKFFVLLVFVGAGVAVWWFYDPYLEPYLGPVVEKVKGKVEELTAKPEKAEPAAEDAESEAPAKEPPPDKVSPESKKPEAKPAAPVVEVKKPEKSEIDKLIEERYPEPVILPLLEIVGNWEKVPQRAFPDQVTIQEKLSFQLKGPGGEVIGASVAAPGTLMKPVRLADGILAVESLANASMRNQIQVDKTDFKQRIQKRYDEFVVKMNDRIQRQREMAKKVLLAKAETDPDAIAAIQKTAGPVGDSGDPRFDPVKASLAAGDVMAATLEEAVGFRWNGSERINGDKYRGLFDTVTVKFEVRTIFGAFPNEFKCLLRNGEVEGWIDPLTMEEKI